MAPPIQISQWLRRTYHKPQVDPEWLDGCYSWVEEEFHLDPATQMEEIIRNVNTQLLESDLTDSMVAGTGLPSNIAEMHNATIQGPILLQIISITEIGNSAFTLQNVRQARIERADMAGLARDEDEEDEGPIPSYPRSMLRFQLSDGATVLQAIEYRRLPGLVLGETKLGFKMLLKDVLIRRGIAFLEPKCVVMKGHQAADLEALQDRDFARDLRLRLGKPDDPAQDEPELQEENAGPPPPPAQGSVQPNAPPAAPAQQIRVLPGRPPFREISEPPSPPVAGPSGTFHDDDEGQPRRRKVPNRAQHSPSPEPPPRTTDNAGSRSRYFASGSGSQSRTHDPLDAITHERLFSPHRQPPIVIPDSDEEDELQNAPSNTLAISGKVRAISGTVIPSPRTHSSEFDFGDDNFEDAAFLEEVSRVEREALAGGATTTQVTDTNATLVETTWGSSSTVLPSLPSASRPASGSNSSLTSNTRAGGTATDRVDLGVITIDDTEEDDKENVPVPTRHVRRRTARSVPTSQQDVIELSD